MSPMPSPPSLVPMPMGELVLVYNGPKGSSAEDFQLRLLLPTSTVGVGSLQWKLEIVE